MNDITQKLCDGLLALAGCPPSAPVPRRVLIVDDDEKDALIIKSALESIGVVAEIASTGEKAIELIRAARPFSRVFLDLSFPVGISGIETLAEVKHIAPLTPVTIVSGYTSPEIIGAAKAIQCDVIDKFTHIEELRKAVLKTMGYESPSESEPPPLGSA